MTKRPLCLLCLLLMFGLCLAEWLGFPLIRGNPLPEKLQKQIENHPQSSICGEVERCADTEFSQSVYLKQTYLIYNSEKISIENVRVFLKEKEEVPAGTVLLVSGKLELVPEPSNPGEFDSRQYYACQHIYYFMKDAVIEKKSDTYSRYGQFLLDVQKAGVKILEKTAKEAAPVFAAIVLGEKSGLDGEIRMRYQMAGIIHILAISGLHISMLGAGLYQLLKRAGLGIWPSGMISLAVMLQYGMMTGGSVSTMRAVCMFLISVGAKILGRIYDMPTALAVSAMLLVTESPAYLYNSSFLLSFGAVLGIGAAAPGLCLLFGVKGRLGKAFLSSAAVQLTTLPVMLYFYGEVSVAGIFLNLAVLPTVGIVLASGAGAVLAGGICVKAGMAAALPGRALLHLYEEMCALASRMPFCTWIGGQPGRWQILGYYALLGGVLILGAFVGKWRERSAEKGREKARPKPVNMLHKKGRSGKSFRRDFWKLRCSAGVLAGILSLTGAVFLLGYRSEDWLEITCLDVGQGDGIVVGTPEGSHFLIDGGSSNKSALAQYQLLPYLKNRGISHLDGIFVSHTDEDHISGIKELLGLMEKNLTVMTVDCLLLPGWGETPKAWIELSKLAEKAGVKVRMGQAGDVILSGDTRITLLAPEPGSRGLDVNEEGMVLQIEYGGFRALFTGDIGETTEKKLLGKWEDVDFLKVGHHGSRYSSCTEFLEKIRPEAAVISCSASNNYGHPSKETIERLEEAGAEIYYTMESGAVTIRTDGKRVEAEEFKQSK